MVKVSKEDNVLKLVRARGLVELYKHPIKAAQIIERYPRHCVTRPDIFKNPFIVVKPESILKPGHVFFIVPCHTIYHLLKSKGYHCGRHYTTSDHNEVVIKQTLQDIRRMENMIDTSFFHQIVPVEIIRNKKLSNRQVGNFSLEVKRDNCAFRDGECEYDEDLAATGASGCFSTHKKGAGLEEASKNIANGCLKPCLIKNQTCKTQALQGPRVRFMLPDEEDEKWDDFPEF